jgi:hypothetical protein
MAVQEQLQRIRDKLLTARTRDPELVTFGSRTAVLAYGLLPLRDSIDE